MKKQAEKVLIVDDSQLVHKGYEILFRSPAYRRVHVITAFHGNEALSRLYDHPDCDLILLDINMPEMSGLEFLKICKHLR